MKNTVFRSIALRIFTSLIIISFICIPVFADIYVANTGSDEAGDGSIGNPYETIQKGLSMASTGGRVIGRGKFIVLK